MSRWFRAWAGGLAVACASCGGADEPSSSGDEASGEVTPPSNRVDLSSDLRRRLGITFAEVTARSLEGTVRVPGVFEGLPSATHHAHATRGGRIQLRVQSLDPVNAGDVLATIDSPGWRRMQREFTEIESEIFGHQRIVVALDALMAEMREHLAAAESAYSAAKDNAARLRRLHDDSGGRLGELMTAAEREALARAEVAEVEEELAATQLERTRVEVGLDRRRREAPRFVASVLGVDDPGGVDLRLAEAASVLGVSEDTVLSSWRTEAFIEVRSPIDGIVSLVETSGGDWVEDGARLCTVVDPGGVRFHAEALQEDVIDALDATRGAVEHSGVREPVEVSVRWGVGDSDHRGVVPLIAESGHWPPWARAGVTAWLTLVIAEARPSLVVPSDCIVRQGLEALVFRRDPKDPEKVIRLDADVGRDDGTWAVLQSGVRLGDEVVRQGAYTLALSGSGKAPAGGHFHADGTFHAEPD